MKFCLFVLLGFALGVSGLEAESSEKKSEKPKTETKKKEKRTLSTGRSLSTGKKLSTGATLSSGSSAKKFKPIKGSKILKTSYVIIPGSASAYLADQIKELETVVGKHEKPTVQQAADRDNNIRGIVSGVLDLDHLGRRAMVAYWDELGESRKLKAKRKDYLNLFKKLVEENYLEKARTYVSGRYEIPLLKETSRKDRQIVVGKILRKDVDLILEFHLMKRAKGWQVVDVRLDDISLEGTYRSSFNRVIRKKGGLETGFPELLEVMDRRLKELKSGSATRL